MIERLLFEPILMPSEQIRIIIALLGAAATAYYDIFNNKNIPNKILYGFLAVALIVNLIFFDQNTLIFGGAVGVIVSLIGYLLYRAGQIGGADVVVILSIILLLPVHPSHLQIPFNLPFIFSVLVFSGVLFSLYSITDIGLKILKNKNAKPDAKYLLMIIPYLVFAYLFSNSPVFSPVYLLFISILFISSLIFMAYKETIRKLMAKKLSLNKIDEEEVVAIELMEPKLVEKYGIKRLVTIDELKRLKKLKVKELWIYTELPAFLPFIFLGIVLGLIFGSSLIMVF